MRLTASAAAVPLLALAACDGPTLGRHGQGLEAYCTALVDTRDRGPVVLDVEADYLPHVVSCENGAAAYAALQAQAIAARSYLYYRVERAGMIGDGTSDQVYTCSRPPSDVHVRAVADTAGVVLRYPPDTTLTQVAAFYVAGALPDDLDTCHGGAMDPTVTERYVTYNEGKSGTDITQTTLGLVNPTNHANRGCMSQNGSDCLAEQGRAYEDILRFYYGEDIAISRATGPCVPDPLDPDAGPAGGGGLPGDELDGGCAAGGGAGVLALAALATIPWTQLRRGRRRRRRR